MTGQDGDGGALPRSPCVCTCEVHAAFGRYPGNPSPHKAVAYMVDGQRVACKGQLPAMLDALVAAQANGDGVAHVEVMPWSLNAGDAIQALRNNHRVQIDTRKGKPSRWHLRSQVSRWEAQQ